MNYKEIIAVIASSTLLSSVINNIQSRYSYNKSNQMKYITEERQNWRKNIKEKTAKFCVSSDQKELIELKTFIALSLNPDDKEDQSILKNMDDYIATRDSEKLKEIEKEVSFLLKYDWERAKEEVGLPSKKVNRTHKKVNKKENRRGIFNSIEDILCGK